MVTTIIASLGDSINFIFGREMNNGDEKHENYKKIIDVFNLFYSAIAFGFYVVTYLLILPFMRLYTAGLDINYVLPLLPWLYISIEILTVGREAMMRTINVAGHFRQTQWRAIIEAAINLTSSIIAIAVCKYFWGEVGGLYGALIGTIVAMLYRTIDMNIYANRKILKRGCWKSFKVMLTNAALFILVVFLIRPIIPEIGNYFQFFLNGVWVTILVLMIFIPVQCLLNFQEVKLVFEYLKQKLVRRKRE